MNLRVPSLTLCLLTSACSPSVAAVPDPANPAHCLAAFNFARYWLAKGDADALKDELTADAMFYYTAVRLKKAGGNLDKAKAESRDFTKSYATNTAAMNALFVTCGQSLAKDRDFITRQAFWMGIAREKNPRCRQEPTCRVQP